MLIIKGLYTHRCFIAMLIEVEDTS